MPNFTTVFRTRIYSGTIQFNLAFNVQTETQSLQLSMSTRTSWHTNKSTFVSILWILPGKDRWSINEMILKFSGETSLKMEFLSVIKFVSMLMCVFRIPNEYQNGWTDRANFVWYWPQWNLLDDQIFFKFAINFF